MGYVKVAYSISPIENVKDWCNRISAGSACTFRANTSFCIQLARSISLPDHYSCCRRYVVTKWRYFSEFDWLERFLATLHVFVCKNVVKMGRGTDVTDERKVLNSIPFRQNKCTQREMAEMFNVFQTAVARKLRETSRCHRVKSVTKIGKDLL